MYFFFRDLHSSFKPSYLYSDDLGSSCRNGIVYINVPSTVKHRSYVGYTSNERDTIHMVYMEEHLRDNDNDNDLYYIYYRSNELYQSDGVKLSSLQVGLDSPDQSTKLYQGDSDRICCVDSRSCFRSQ